MKIKTFQEFIFEGTDVDLSKEDEVQAKIREQMKIIDAKQAKIDDSKKKPSEKEAAKSLLVQQMAKLHANLSKSKDKQARLMQTAAKSM